MIALRETFWGHPDHGAIRPFVKAGRGTDIVAQGESGRGGRTAVRTPALCMFTSWWPTNQYNHTLCGCGGDNRKRKTKLMNEVRTCLNSYDAALRAKQDEVDEVKVRFVAWQASPLNSKRVGGRAARSPVHNGAAWTLWVHVLQALYEAEQKRLAELTEHFRRIDRNLARQAEEEAAIKKVRDVRQLGCPGSQCRWVDGWMGSILVGWQCGRLVPHIQVATCPPLCVALFCVGA